MNPTITIVASAFLFVHLITFTHPARGDDDFSKEVEKATRLSPSLYLIEGAGGNITASVGKDGVLLVDDDYYEMSEKLRGKLKELKGSEPRIIVNTHFHYDHTGGNRAFPLATIIAAHEVRESLSSEQTLWKKTHPAMLDGLPDLTFEDRLTLHFNNEAVQVIHLKNGHTDGDTVVIFTGSKAASLGDLYFSGMYPIFHPEHGGSLRHYVENIEQVLRLLPENATVVPGHGPLSDKKGLAAYAEMIRDSVRTVKSAIKHGWSLGKITAHGLDPKWEPYGHGYRNTAQWIESVFERCKEGDCP